MQNIAYLAVKPKTPLMRRIMRDLLPPDLCDYVSKQAQKTGLSLLDALLSSSLVTIDEFYRGLARVTGAGFTESFPVKYTPLLEPSEWREALVSHLFPMQNETGALRYWHCPHGADLAKFIDNCERDPGFSRVFILTTPHHYQLYLRRYARRLWSAGAISTLSKHAPRFSAFEERGLKRFALILSFFLIAFAFGCMMSDSFAFIMGGGFSVIFYTLLIFRVYFCFYKPVKPPQIALKSIELPVYTVVLALYKEAEMVPHLLNALESLDYPRAKLDVKLVLEADDRETFMALRACETPLALDIIIAPPEGPRTKPKALMLALPYARGEFLCVYDAEDRPHPLQLREAAGVFAAGSSRLAVLQAPLIIRNASKNMITRFFSADYASLFDVLLPALTRFNLPLPLGGTSNHFRLSHLRKVGGWDPYNVTEDADLGLRLARFNLEAGVITRGTTEEAPEEFDIWLKQRTRWFKGWLQTLYVHFSRPRDLIRDVGLQKAMTMFILLGGSFASALLHPFGLFVTIIYPSIFSVSTLIIGYILGAYVLYAGSNYKKRHPPGWALLLIPFWWLVLSIAAWRAVKELYLRPFHWAKTPHGVK
jgi:glycosyltransferase XagB